MNAQYTQGNAVMTEHHDEDEDRSYFANDAALPQLENRADVIKVSAKSRSTAVAGAIAAVIREHRYAEVQAIGAGAVNQAVKALAIARGYLTGDEIDIVCVPYFTEVDIEGQERTAVRFIVEPRPVLPA
jgi:stage V sporulation protein S